VNGQDLGVVGEGRPSFAGTFRSGDFRTTPSGRIP
jgi:hypothetical protein